MLAGCCCDASPVTNTHTATSKHSHSSFPSIAGLLSLVACTGALRGSFGRGGNFDTDHYEKYHQHVIGQYNKDCKRESGRLQRLQDKVGNATAIRCFENARNGVRYVTVRFCRSMLLLECTLYARSVRRIRYVSWPRVTNSSKVRLTFRYRREELERVTKT